MLPAIDSFSGIYRFLSNFYPIEVLGPGGFTYPTTEHAFQAAKTKVMDEIHDIRSAATPGDAKGIGRSVTLRPDWEFIKDYTMLTLLRRKFGLMNQDVGGQASKDLGKKLLATGDAELIEGNTWNDKYWGVCNGEGQNKLGKMLMLVRSELKEIDDNRRKSS